MAKKTAEIVCPHCRKTVVAYRTKKGRILITTSAGVALAVAGGIIGAGIGLVTGGTGMPATIPMAAVGAVVGSGLGYLVSDKMVDKPSCPSCDKPINLEFN